MNHNFYCRGGLNRECPSDSDEDKQDSQPVLNKPNNTPFDYNTVTHAQPHDVQTYGTFFIRLCIKLF